MASNPPPRDPAPQPSPYSASPLPTPRALLVNRLGIRPRVAVGLVAAVFLLILGGYAQNANIAGIDTVWDFLFVGLLVLAIGITYLPREQSSLLRSLPSMDEVYLAKQYARAASALVITTVAGMVVLAVFIFLGSAGVKYGIPSAVSATSQTITVVGAIACIMSSFGLVRVLLSHAPPFDRTFLNPLERSNLPEIVFTLGLVGCPAYVFAAAFLWNRPELVRFGVVVPTHGVLLIVGGVTAVYLALVTRY